MKGIKSIPTRAVAALCKRYAVRELALFGSALGKNFRDDSDVDLLVEFRQDASVGFLLLARLQRELSQTLGRRVDLVPKNGLKPTIRDEILATARVLYAA
jgi:predicted nucleotidyltransferase